MELRERILLSVMRMEQVMMPNINRLILFWKKVRVKVLVAVLLFVFYFVGYTHGTMQAVGYVVSEDCQYYGFQNIYPYGCKIDNNSNYCINVDCQQIFLPRNFAYCIYMNRTPSWADYWSTIKLGAIIGCPVHIESVGTNPHTGNENWWIK